MKRYVLVILYTQDMSMCVYQHSVSLSFTPATGVIHMQSVLEQTKKSGAWFNHPLE